MFPYPGIHQIHATTVPTKVLFTAYYFPVRAHSTTIALFGMNPARVTTPIGTTVLEGLQQLVSLSLSVFSDLWVVSITGLA